MAMHMSGKLRHQIGALIVNNETKLTILSRRIKMVVILTMYLFQWRGYFDCTVPGCLKIYKPIPPGNMVYMLQPLEVPSVFFAHPCLVAEIYSLCQSNQNRCPLLLDRKQQMNTRFQSREKQ